MKCAGAAISQIALALASAAALAQAPPPIPLQALFGEPMFHSPRLSPSGRDVAVILARGDEQVIVIRPIAGGALTAVAAFNDPGVRLQWIDWANEERLLFASEFRLPGAVEVRARGRRLYSVARAGGEVRWLGKNWPGNDKFTVKYRQQFEDQIVSWLPSDPEHILVTVDNPVTGDPRVMALDVEKGGLSLRQSDVRGIGKWYANRDGYVVAGVGSRDAGNTLYRVFARLNPGASLEKVIEFDVDLQNGPWLAALHADPRKLYVGAEHEGRRAIYEYDLVTRKTGPPLFAQPDVDVDGVSMHGRVLCADFTVDWPQRHCFDARAQKVNDALTQALAAQFGPATAFEIVSETDDHGLEILRASSDLQPPSYFVHDTKTHALTHLLDARPKVPVAALSPSKRVTYSARDGLAIPAILTLPKGREPKRLPLIVMPHGGPRARDSIGWNAEVQLFASRGFAVLQPNFRGSSGFGSAFELAGYREWGGKMQDDLSDGVKWLVAEGIADADRVGIYGVSYGGYAALMGLVKTPALFRAGASYAGVTDLPLLLKQDRRYERREKDANAETIGDDPEMLRERSPVNRAAEMRAPVLIGHGEIDDRVHVLHSQRMAKALRDARKDVTYLEFPSEIHGFELESNRIRWYEALIAFFEKNLAPRAQRAGSAAAPPAR
jgi:dipeptidyl aminopeptidase/acylaminoacyl peptidase